MRFDYAFGRCDLTVRFDIVTLFPEMIRSCSDYGIVARAHTAGIITLRCWDPREFTVDAYRTVDDRPYGGGPGMVMKIGPLRAAVAAAQAAQTQPRSVIYLSPQGRRLDQAGVRALAQRPGLVLIAGRYEGIDQRMIDHGVDEEYSIGDYVLSGGELAAMVLIDAVTRLLPGALGDERSAQQDSFSDGLLDCPHYTRPEVDEWGTVPAVLLGGNHSEIQRWRLKRALGITWLRRPDLIAQRHLSNDERVLLDEFIAECGPSMAGGNR